MIPCYNREKYIGDAINSVLRQTIPVKELIVVDDGSTDGSVAVVREFEPRVRLIRQANGGASVARNVGLKASGGEFVIFLDSDDWISDDMVECHLRAASQFPEASVFSADSASVDASGSVRVEPSNWPSGPDRPLELVLLFNLPYPACLMYRRVAIEGVGGFDETLRASNDCDALIRVVLEGGKIVRTPGGYGVYRTVPGSITSNLVRLHKSRLQLSRKLQRQYSGNASITALIRQRLHLQRYEYFNWTIAFHCRWSPAEVAKLMFHALRISVIDPLFFPSLVMSQRAIPKIGQIRT